MAPDVPNERYGRLVPGRDRKLLPVLLLLWEQLQLDFCQSQLLLKKLAGRVIMILNMNLCFLFLFLFDSLSLPPEHLPLLLLQLHPLGPRHHHHVSGPNLLVKSAFHLLCHNCNAFAFFLKLFDIILVDENLLFCSPGKCLNLVWILHETHATSVVPPPTLSPRTSRPSLGSRTLSSIWPVLWAP